LRVRFEDLCAKPVLTIRQIFDFLELEGDVQEIAQIEVRPPDSLGRWQKQNKDLVTELHRAGAIALETFGYSVPKPQPVLKASGKKIARLTAKRPTLLKQLSQK
jgi:hypothetical protein